MNETDDQRIDRLKKERDELTELADDLGSKPTPRSIDLRKHADEKHEEATQLMERQLEDAETIKATDATSALLGEDNVMKSTEALGAVAREDGGYRTQNEEGRTHKIENKLEEILRRIKRIENHLQIDELERKETRGRQLDQQILPERAKLSSPGSENLIDE